MTSQGSYSKYQLPFQEANKCLRSNEMGHTCQSSVEKVQRVSSSKDQLTKSSSSNYFTKSSKYPAAQAGDYKNGNKRRCSFSFSKTCEMTNQKSYNSQNGHLSNVLGLCTDNCLENQSDSVQPHDVSVNAAVAQSALRESAFGKCLGELETKVLQKHYLQPIATEVSKPENGEIVDKGISEKESKRNISVNNDSANIVKKDNGLIANSKSFNKNSESKYFESSHGSQTFTKLRPHFNQCLHTSILPTARKIFNALSMQISKEPRLQKCRSLVSVARCPVKHERFSSIDYNILHTKKVLEDSYSNNNDIPSENSCSVWKSKCQLLKAIACEDSECSSPRSQHSTSNQSRKTPSTNIQRIQQQLMGRQVEDDNKTGYTAQKTTVPEKIHRFETERSGTVNRKGFAYPNRLQVEEKPYRQWHRMSRVATAESKFIISPMLPNRIYRGKKQNTVSPSENQSSLDTEDKIGSLLPGKSTESLAAEKQIESGCKTETCDCNHTDGSILNFPGLDKFKTRQLHENKEMETLCAKKDTAVNALSMLLKQLETGISETTDPSCDTFSVLISKTECKSSCADCSPIKAEGSVTYTPSCTNTPAPNESTLVTNSALSPDAILPRYKSFTIKNVQKARLTELNEASMSFDHSIGCGFPPNNTSDKMRTLSSVSRVSQVMGPSFYEQKKKVLAEPSYKKMIYFGPKLRTAERCRNRGKAAAIVAASFGMIRGVDSHATFFKEPQDAERNVSRNSSMNSACDSKKFNSELEYPQIILSPPQVCTDSEAVLDTDAADDKDYLEYTNRNWSSDNGVAVEAIKESLATTVKTAAPRKLFLADVVNKLFHRVHLAGLRVPWSETPRKYINVKATQDYSGSFPGQLSFRKGQIIKQRCFSTGPSDGMSYGYYRVGRLRMKRKGLFPSKYVTKDAIDRWEVSDKDSLTSSSKSSY